MWVWDEYNVSSTDVAGNVLDLLSSKMSGLSANVQSALKLAACFGIKIKESIITTLGRDPDHSDIRDNLERVVKEGFMVKVGTSEFKFVHDKVREAAYCLVPEQEKNQVSATAKALPGPYVKLGLNCLIFRLWSLHITSVSLQHWDVIILNDQGTRCE
jgi:hypothetical protein